MIQTNYFDSVEINRIDHALRQSMTLSKTKDAYVLLYNLVPRMNNGTYYQMIDRSKILISELENYADPIQKHTLL